MKKFLLVLSLLAVGLSGCYVAPHRDRDGGYRGDRGDHDQRRDDDRGRDRDRDRSHDGYR